MAYTDYLETVQRLYVAYYQRPADPEGLVYWAKALDWAGSDQSLFYQVVDAFANSAESKALYGSGSTSDVINAIYKAAFGRDAEPEGLQYWTDAIQKGYTTIGRVLWEIVKPGSPSMNDAVTLSNKLTSAMNFTRVIDPELDGLNLLAKYSGPNDAKAAREWLATVTNNPATVKDINACKEFIIQKIADSGDPIVQGTSGTTIVLTSSIDVKEGTNYNDLFIGDRAGGAALQTVQAGDTLNGLGGTDTLRLFGFTGKAVIIPNISNIEVIDVVGNATKVDVSLKSDVKTLIYRDMNLATIANLTVASGQTIELRNIQNATARAIKIIGASGVKTVDVVVDGVNELENSTNLTVKNITLRVTNAFTALNLIADSKPSDLTIAGLDAGEKLNIKGTQDITLTFTAAFATPPDRLFIDASNNSGVVTLRLEDVGYLSLNDNRLNGVDNIVIFSNAGQTVNLSNQTEAFNITGGAGADIITGGAGADTINGRAGNDIINGGAGNDTINGGAGNDVINGGAGADTINGRAGNDKFVFANFATADIIKDFATGDLLMLDLAKTGTNGIGTKRIVTNMTGTMTGTQFAKVLNKAGTITSMLFDINKATANAQMLTAMQLFSAKNTTALISAVQAQAKMNSNANAIAFGRTTAHNKLYLILISDTMPTMMTAGTLINIKTIATVGAAFGAGDIFIF